MTITRTRFVALGGLALAAFALSACMKPPESTPAPASTEQQKPEPPAPQPEPPAPLVPPGPQPPPKVDNGTPKDKSPGKGKGSLVGSVPLLMFGELIPGLGGAGGGGTVRPADPGVTQKYKTALVGTWTADLGGGTTEELTYKDDGTYTAALKGKEPQTAGGKYTVVGPSGTRGLRVKLDPDGGGSRTVHAVFEGDELIHPALQPGVTGTYRKKK